MGYEKSSGAPFCASNACFACLNGRCAVLTDNRFKRGCPFFKTGEQKQQQEEVCKERIRLWERRVSNG